MPARIRASVVVVLLLSSALWSASSMPASAAPNPVALTAADYLALGRVFSDPQGCLNNGPAEPDSGVSPWAKGAACFEQFLHYEETIDGAKFLDSMYPRYMSVIRLDQAYDNPDYRSAGLPQEFGFDEDDEPEVLSRERKPLYMFKVTDEASTVAEADRKHFVYSLSIHGIERAGVEGGIRAMEDLVTWAACENGTLPQGAGFPPATPAPACNPALPTHYEGPPTGPFAKPIVETSPAGPRNPTTGSALQNSVIYFLTPNPDGWERGEVGEGDVFFQRYNGNGMDLNRDWPTKGYTYRPYSPASEPETIAYKEVLHGIRNAHGDFTGGIDLHGQLTANAYSYTLLGAGQRDYRKNFSTVEQALRAWADQSERLAWSPYVTNTDANPGTNHPGVFPVADQWGTVFDTLGYQITGGVGDWMDSPLGLNAVGIDNEMSLSHLAPNTGYDPTNEQMHVDGNKGLIYSQIASMLTETDSDYEYEPNGKIGYVFNPKVTSHPGSPALNHPGLPAQNDIDALLPCATGTATCDGGEFYPEGTNYHLEFPVQGPPAFFNGGITVQATFLNVNGVSLGSASRLQLQHYDPESGGEWQTVASSFVQGGQPDAYLEGGQIVTANDPVPGPWRVRVTNAGNASVRLEIDFKQFSAEDGKGQAAFEATPMEFFEELNTYIDDPADKLTPVPVMDVITDPSSLDEFDSLVVVTEALPAYSNAAGASLGLTAEQEADYYDGLEAFATNGGNLVLTDGALHALHKMGVLAPTAIKNREVLAGRYQFLVPGRGDTCPPWSPDPKAGAPPGTTYPDHLTEAVCLPGTAGRTSNSNSRQGVEPVPIGYTPDTGLDGHNDARMTEWWLDRTAWETDCGKEPVNRCTSAITGSPAGTTLGERHIGGDEDEVGGVIRIAGTMFPEPNFKPGGVRDMRFGLSSYSLTFSTWQVFLNLVDYVRPTEPGLVDLTLTKTDAPDPVVEGQDITYTLAVSNVAPQAPATPATAFGVVVTDDLPEGVTFKSASDGCTYADGVVTCTIGELEAGRPVEKQIVVTTTQPGTITNTATVSGDQNQTDYANDTATAETTVTAVAVSPPPPDPSPDPTPTPDPSPTPPPPPAAPTSPGPDRCPGYEDAAGNHIVGTDDSETLEGTDGNDVICGLEGDDVIEGGAGNDLLVGNEGNDTIKGGAGNDRIPSGFGVDVIRGGPGNDRITAGEGADRVSGDDGNDRINGGGGNDRLKGNADDDKLFGVYQNDRLQGGAGSDTHSGGPGRDRCAGAGGLNRYLGCEDQPSS